jgi:hypothetical protein
VNSRRRQNAPRFVQQTSPGMAAIAGIGVVNQKRILQVCCHRLPVLLAESQSFILYNMSGIPAIVL